MSWYSNGRNANSFSGPPGYGGPPGAYNSYGAYGGAPGTALPAAGAPGTAAPPGVTQAQQPNLPGRPGAFPPNFPQTPNFPKDFDTSASVIRLGGASGPPRGLAADGPSSRPPNSRRAGLGLDSDMRGGDQDRKKQESQVLVPPTREEMMRSILVSDIPAHMDDFQLERILSCPGGLRHFVRIKDSNNRPLDLGIAEYADADTLLTSIRIFSEPLKVPKDKITPRTHQTPKANEDSSTNGVNQQGGEEGKDGEDDADKVRKEEDSGENQKEEESEEEIATSFLKFTVDETSKDYADEWKERRKVGDDEVELRVDGAKEMLAGVLRSLFNPQQAPDMDLDGNTIMQDTLPIDNTGNAEIVTIPLTAGEDELSDIPAEMRATVQAEIQSFRDRSVRREMERAKIEEQIASEDRQKARSNVRSTPPASAPTGPAAGANGIPLGPRAERGVAGAPSGPRGFMQIPREFQDGVSFVNGGTMNTGGGHINWIRPEDEDDSASDSEIENRRRAKKKAEQEKMFRAEEESLIRRHSKLNQTSRRGAQKEKDLEREAKREQERLAKYLKTFDDDAPDSRDEYTRDTKEWAKRRESVRERELELDDADRKAEQRELAQAQQRRDAARGPMDRSRNGMPAAVEPATAPAAPRAFKMNLGAAAKKAAAMAPRRTAAEVEDLLDDEDVADGGALKRGGGLKLKKLDLESDMRPANLDQEEVALLQKELAQEIPTETKDLFDWNISWEHLKQDIINGSLRSVTRKKLVELLGFDEEMLVDLVVQQLNHRGKPEDIIEELSEALEPEDAENLVKKIWRMVVFYSECEKRGYH